MKKEDSAKENGGIQISAKNLKYIIYGAIILIAALLVIGFVVMNSGDKTGTTDNSAAGTPAAQDASAAASAENKSAGNYEILEQSTKIDMANGNKIIEGKIKNTGEVTMYSVEITATLYDANNKIIGTKITRPLFNDLEPEQVSYFSISDIYHGFSTYELEVTWKLTH